MNLGPVRASNSPVSTHTFIFQREAKVQLHRDHGGGAEERNKEKEQEGEVQLGGSMLQTGL